MGSANLRVRTTSTPAKTPQNKESTNSPRGNASKWLLSVLKRSSSNQIAVCELIRCNNFHQFLARLAKILCINSD